MSDDVFPPGWGASKVKELLLRAQAEKQKKDAADALQAKQTGTKTDTRTDTRAGNQGGGGPKKDPGGGGGPKKDPGGGGGPKKEPGGGPRKEPGGGGRGRGR